MQAAAHEAALAAALSAGGEADSALRAEKEAVHLADQGRRAADKRAVRHPDGSLSIGRCDWLKGVRGCVFLC